MSTRFEIAGWLALSFGLLTFSVFVTAQEAEQHEGHKSSDSKAEPHEGHKSSDSRVGRAPEELPQIPAAKAASVDVPRGYAVEVVFDNLTYPTSIEFDDTGAMYIAEGGYIYGDEVAQARILRIGSNDHVEVVAENLSGPVTDLLWHEGRLFISQRGKISVLESEGVRDLVTGLPSLGDHHNNQLTIGPDGKLYFGQGVATNSGVVGLDNFNIGWLAKYPEVHDIPAKDIRVSDQAFATPDPLKLLGPQTDKESDQQQHQDHGQAEQQDTSEQQQDSSGEHQEHGHKHTETSAGHTGSDSDERDASAKEEHGSTEHEEGKHEQHAQPKTENDSSGDQDNSQDHGNHKQAADKNAESGGHEGHATKRDDKNESKQQDASAEHSHHGEADNSNDSSDNDKDSKKQEKESQGEEGKDQGSEHAHHQTNGDKDSSAQSHAGHGEENADELGEDKKDVAKTFAFEQFGNTPPDNGALRGTIKANGTILRMNLDGSNLEMYAWGLRNPFGLKWGPDGNLYASDNGYDERGSRPIAHAPDCLWEIKPDAWYGFPDFAGGTPVTDARFRPEKGPPPKFLMRDHPPCEKPLLLLQHHVGAAKIDFCRNKEFGFDGQMFLALSGDMNPITGEHEERSGFEVVRVDMESGAIDTFFKAKKNALGPKGLEYVATSGPRRPVDVVFSRDGKSLYIVDVGAMAIVSTGIGPAPRPFPGTGVIWRISRQKN